MNKSERAPKHINKSERASKSDRLKRPSIGVALFAVGALVGSLATVEIIEAGHGNSNTCSDAITIAQNEASKKILIDQIADSYTKSLKPENVLPNAGTLSINFLAGTVSIPTKDGTMTPLYRDPIILSEITNAKSVSDLVNNGSVYLGIIDKTPDGSFEIAVRLYDSSYMQFDATNPGRQIMNADVYAQQGKDDNTLYAYDAFAKRTLQQPNGEALIVGQIIPLN
ncbi:hypothetical protein H7171_00105 [Candidatus Saccharibacteria bacterium]|nr:hypothetical protein [Candidatus Saccharibacteria bacterium]